jgi:hypothetical protein
MRGGRTAQRKGLPTRPDAGMPPAKAETAWSGSAAKITVILSCANTESTRSTGRRRRHRVPARSLASKVQDPRCDSGSSWSICSTSRPRRTAVEHRPSGAGSPVPVVQPAHGLSMRPLRMRLVEPPLWPGRVWSSGEPLDPPQRSAGERQVHARRETRRIASPGSQPRHRRRARRTNSGSTPRIWTV